MDHQTRHLITNEEILTTEEAMQLLRISRPTLLHLIHSRQIPARKLGNQWRFVKQALMDYVAGKDHVSRSIGRKK